MSDRAIGLALALGCALVGPRGEAFAAALDGGASGSPAAVRSVCASLDACLAAVEALPTKRRPGDSLNDEKLALQGALRGYGKAAIPGLLRLLASPEPETREIAALALSGVDGLAPTDLPTLQRAFDAGESRLAVAIASTGAPEAVPVLYAALKANPHDYWIPSGFARLGRKGVPTLMGAFDCRDRAAGPLDPFARTPCDLALVATLPTIFEELGPEGSDAVTRLADIARDTHRTPPVRLLAIKALGFIGPDAASTAPALQALARADRATFGRAVETALFGMKVPAAGKIVVARLAHASDREVRGLLFELARLGAGGQPAATQVLAQLHNPDFETRAVAAIALGYLGDRRAVAPLIAALDHPEDWQLSYVAAGSLGRLGDPRADAALAALERDHWYPPVREAARKARAVIAGRERHVSRSYPADSGYDLDDYAHAGRDVKPCRPHDQSGRQVFFPDDDLRRAHDAKVTYASGILSYRPGRGETSQRQVPSAALEATDGWLLGTSRGEWGGELVFLDRAGRQTLVVTDNIYAVARLGTRIVALAGLAHMFGNRGLVYEVARDPRGRWSARPWRVLPGAPWASTLQPDGGWLIDTNSGTIVLAPDGQIRMATCSAR